MDELLIDDKKYLSTKRAAKVTGYAKDYVGQLCREGRVQARLVGRGWYVLETAIREHRFGLTEPSVPTVSLPRSAPEEMTVQIPKSEKPALQATWSAPRYFPASGNDIPYLHSARVDEPKAAEIAPHADLVAQEAVPVENINQAWREWFADRAENAELPVGEESSPRALNILATRQEVAEDVSPAPSVAPEISGADEEVPLVRNEGYRQPVQPVYAETAVPISSVWKNTEPVPPSRSALRPMPRRSGWVVRTVRVVGLFLAITAALIALIGSGRFDAAGLSNGYLGRISGINVVSK